MGDILSQNEIDDLLMALNTGEIDLVQINNDTMERKIKNHDFRKPNKLSKEHIRTLYNVHENYARLLTTYLTGYLRTIAQVEVLEVQALPYGEFSNSIPNPSLLAVANFSPLEGSIVFELSLSVGFAIVERILGGKCSASLNEKPRGFTEIEIAIFEKLLVQILNILREPWETITELRPKLEKIETNSQFAQVVSPSEIVALITLNAKIGETQGIINICIPYMVLEPVVPKLSTRMWYSTEHKEITAGTRNTLETGIQDSPVMLRALLGKTKITVMDFLELQKGDVIPLDSNINGDLDITVGDVLKFKGRPGVRKNKMAVKISEVIKRGD